MYVYILVFFVSLSLSLTYDVLCKSGYSRGDHMVERNKIAIVSLINSLIVIRFAWTDVLSQVTAESYRRPSEIPG